jgi:hypothetical protein
MNKVRLPPSRYALRRAKKAGHYICWSLPACRVADACDHAEHAAQPEIGRSDSPARLPSPRSSCIEAAGTL